MNGARKINRKDRAAGQRGAALITTLIISLLLVTACVAMLTAAGHHSRNVTDVLSETKAYYAAESGIQATINVLRGNTEPLDPYDATPTDQDISYTRASKPTESNRDGEISSVARLSRWLDYNYTPAGKTLPDRVVIGTPAADYTPNSGTAYSVEVDDPDNTSELTEFTTVGSFLQSDGITFASSRTYGSAGNTITISFEDVATPVTVQHSEPAKTSLGSFKIVKQGTGAQITDKLRFRIDYKMTKPRIATRSIRGEITQASPTSVNVNYDSYKYFLVGSTITLCENEGCTSPSPLGSSFAQTMTVPTPNPNPNKVYASLTPVEPYRLRLKSTGYGPNGARKQLEAIIQRNFFNDLASSSAVAMIGPGAGFVFKPGESAQVTYCGVEYVPKGEDDPKKEAYKCEVPAGTIVATVPSIGLSDPANLKFVLDNPPKTAPNPPPALLGAETPDWQQSSYALDNLINLHQIAAEKSLRYFPSGDQPADFGDYTKGTGITFCDGDCELQGNGGGILIVTGKLTLVGNFGFKGLIIVTGADGVVRKGAGNGQIIGNLIIAPYDPNNLAAGFLPPKYDMSGGGISDIIYSSSSIEFDGQTAISDFMQGVAEK